MLRDRPRGIVQNKNAANIQQFNDNVIEKPHLRQLKPFAQRVPNQVDSENVITLASLKSLTQPQDVPKANVNPYKDDPKKVLTLENFDKGSLNLINLNGQKSPNEPSPPKLKSKQRPTQQPVSRIPMLSMRLKPNKPKDQVVPPIKEKEEKEELIVIENIDTSNTRDAIFLVCDVAKDIYDYMFELERAQAVSENYLKDQRILTPKVRQRLINWCIEINTQLRLLPETLYITVATIDRFFDKFVVEQQTQVQLFASAATLIASKYEEIYPPEVKDLVYLTQHSYTKREILRAEMFVLKTLEFDLGKPIPLAFLRRFSKAAHCNLKMHSIAKYLMELSLTEYECCHWDPSFLAAAALFTSLFLVAAYKTESPKPSRAITALSTRVSLAPLPVNGKTTSRSQIGSSSNVSSNSGGRLTRSRTSLANSYVNQIIDKVWTKQMVYYTRYQKDELHSPASILCKILRRSQRNPLSYYCVKKNSQELPKWPELKCSKVDDLIMIGSNSPNRPDFNDCKSA